MRRSFALLFLVVALPLCAAEWRSPAWYRAQLEASKKMYNIDVKPAADPIDEYTCRPRVMEFVRIREGGRWTLGIPKRHPDAAKILSEAESLYGKKQYAEAAVRYRKLIALDANDAIAHLFLGDTFLFGSDDYAAALAEYRKALGIDPTNPSAYFFSANALTLLGRGDEARAALVKALSYNPVYENLYRALAQPDAFGIRPLTRHRFEPPRGYAGKPDDEGITVYPGADREWLAYAQCKAVLRNEPAVRKEVLGDVEEVEASFEEERACVTSHVDGSLARARAALEKTAGKKPVTDAEVIAAAPPLVRHLVEVLNAGLFDGYIAFELLGQRCPIAASMFPEELHGEVEKYVGRYLIVKK